MNYLRMFYYLTVIMIIFPIILFSQVPQPSGDINWERKYIEATGYGGAAEHIPVNVREPASLDAARGHALATLLAQTQGLNINQRKTIENLQYTKGRREESVQGVIKNWKVISETYDAAKGFATSTVRVYLDGEGGVVDEMLKQVDTGIIKDGEIEPVKEVPQVVPQQEEQSQPTGNEIYSGLIVDASSLGKVEQAMFPKIVDEYGNEVYGTSFVSRKFVVQNGLVGYTNSLQRARSDSRIGTKPIEIKGIKSSGVFRKVDIVISNEDATKLRKLGAGQRFLQECRVIIVI